MGSFLGSNMHVDAQEFRDLLAPLGVLHELAVGRLGCGGLGLGLTRWLAMLVDALKFLLDGLASAKGSVGRAGF